MKVDLINKLAQDQDSVKQNAKQWTSEETLKMLECLEKYGDNWEEVAKSLGINKSREEVILHFLQLPLKNISSVHLFDNGEDQQQTKKDKFPIEQLQEEDPNVFSDYSNPLLQHVREPLLHLLPRSLPLLRPPRRPVRAPASRAVRAPASRAPASHSPHARRHRSPSSRVCWTSTRPPARLARRKLRMRARTRPGRSARATSRRALR